jgi:hypothetical protein
MFDTYRVYGPNKIQIDISQKETTTAEAARLYHELLEKARVEVLETLTVNNDLVDFHALRINTGLQTKIVVAFKLNGELYVTEAPMNYVEMLVHANKMELIRFVIQRMSEVIAEKLIQRLETL